MMSVGVSHGGANVSTSDGPSSHVLVGTNDGVAVLDRTASGWQVSQRALPGRFISSIVFEPDSGMAVAGAFFDTVYASADGGLTWDLRGDGIAYKDVYSLAAKPLPDGGSRLYAGTQPAHLFQSDDLGRYWTELPAMRAVPSVDQWNFPSPPHVAHTKFIQLDPAQPSAIYACIEQGALLRSEDLGETWSEVNTLGRFLDPDRPSEVFYDIHKLLIDPRDSSKLFVTGGAGLYVSIDRGARWERRMAPGWAPDVYPDGLVFNPLEPDVMFMSAAEHNPSTWRSGGVPGYSGSRLYRSTDAGVTWQQLRGGLPDRLQEEFGGLSLEAWPGGCQVFAATSAGDVWWSEDGGDSWQPIASGLGAIAKKGHDRLLSSEDLGRPVAGRAR